MARDAGANKVYLGITSPPLVAPCPYGIDMAAKKDFIATDRSSEEVAAEVGADFLMHLDRERMNAAARKGNTRIEKFCNACFTGDYPTGDVTREMLEDLADERDASQAAVPCS